MAKTKSPVREALATMFMESLQQERLPWNAGWVSVRPENCVNGKRYKGINRLYLSYVADEMGWSDPRWCTYKQAQSKGWQVRKGEKGHRVEYWAFYDTQQKKLLSWKEVRQLVTADPSYEKNLILNCRTYTVFNAAQIDGIPPYQTHPLDIGDLRNQRDTLLQNMGVGFHEGGNEAYYSPRNDQITLPEEWKFRDTYYYLSTLLHEAGHATGHPSRLNRDLHGVFGSEDYAREELRAEIASTFVAQDLGLPQDGADGQHHRFNHTAYIQSWITKLEKDPDELMKAITDAEKIADYLIEKGEFRKDLDLEPEITPEKKITELTI